MKYTVDIQGMHCNGCTRLVAMGMAEEDLQQVNVDLAANRATFESVEKREAVQARITRIASELSDYSFSAVREA